MLIADDAVVEEIVAASDAVLDELEEEEPHVVRPPTVGPTSSGPDPRINYMGFKPFPGATQYDYDRMQLKLEGYPTVGFKSWATKAEREQYQLDWEALVARGRPVVPAWYPGTDRQHGGDGTG